MDIVRKRKIIDNFMDWKDKKLSDIVKELKRHEYYNNEDKTALAKLSDEEINDIYASIKWINEIDEGGLSDAMLCPFCILYTSWPICPSCTYHDECAREGSTYKKIIGFRSIRYRITFNVIRGYIQENFK